MQDSLQKYSSYKLRSPCSCPPPDSLLKLLVYQDAIVFIVLLVLLRGLDSYYFKIT